MRKNEKSNIFFYEFYLILVFILLYYSVSASVSISVCLCFCSLLWSALHEDTTVLCFLFLFPSMRNKIKDKERHRLAPSSVLHLLSKNQNPPSSPNRF